jgi:hypothetical protein
MMSRAIVPLVIVLLLLLLLRKHQKYAEIVKVQNKCNAQVVREKVFGFLILKFKRLVPIAKVIIIIIIIIVKFLSCIYLSN